MFLDKFLKKAQVEKTQEQLQKEFEAQMTQFKSAVHSPVYTLFKEFFQAKQELNRDQAFELNPLNKKEALIIQRLHLENKIMADFISEIESAAQTEL